MTHTHYRLRLLSIAIVLAVMPARAAPADDSLEASAQQLQRLGAALLEHESTTKTFPSATGRKIQGNPPLVSWRVQLLPYLGEPELHFSYRRNEPWDSENNKKLIPKMPKVFAAPGSKASGVFKTVYLTPRSAKSMFPGDSPDLRMKSCTDGISRTIGVIEASDDSAVIWTMPDDYEIDEAKPAAGLGGLRDTQILACFLDGTVRALPQSIDPAQLNAMFTRAGGENIDRDWLSKFHHWPGPQPIPRADFKSVVLNVPATADVHRDARRARSLNNLYQLSVGVHRYKEEHKHYPRAYLTSDADKPLLSWRVLLLPYLGESPLYKKFKLDEPWDSNHNLGLLKEMPAILKAPGSKAASEFKTTYLTPRGDKTLFPTGKALHINDTVDGGGEIIMFLEVADDKAVPWTKPDDYIVDEKNPIKGIVGTHEGEFFVTLANGSVRSISDRIDSANLNALYTCAGREMFKWEDIANTPLYPPGAPISGKKP